MIEKDWTAIAQSCIEGKYNYSSSKGENTSKTSKTTATNPTNNEKDLDTLNNIKISTKGNNGNGGIVDCGENVELSASELYDQLRLLRDITSETLVFMKVCLCVWVCVCLWFVVFFLIFLVFLHLFCYFFFSLFFFSLFLLFLIRPCVMLENSKNTLDSNL